MADIVVEHRGYVIRFNENADEWACHDAGYYSSPSLAKVRARIDKIALDTRKKAAVDCFEISGGSWRSTAEKVPAKIIEFIKTKADKDYRGNPLPPKHIVASVAQRSMSERASRKEVYLAELMPDTPEAHAAFARFDDACKRLREAQKAADEALKAVPRMTIDMIDELVRIASDPALTQGE